jgi:superoxide dismutase, Cu-Zn family
MRTLPLALACLLLASPGCAPVQKIVRGPVASVTLLPTKGNDVRGSVTFTPARRGKAVAVAGHITGLTPGPHGMHVHVKGDCTAPDASSAGGHFDPGGHPHSSPDEPVRHAGDLGNVIADADGIADFGFEVEGLSVGADAASIIGRALIIHADADDLRSQPSGNSGKRLACGLVSKGR